jgi:hypothetical protein
VAAITFSTGSPSLPFERTKTGVPSMSWMEPNL